MRNPILFITDPFDSLKQEKDTSVFIMKEALKRDFEVFQCEMSDLTLKERLSSQCSQVINNNDILEIAKENVIDLVNFSFCFMRKDPPVDQDYMNCLHLLNIASQNGANIINNPNAIKIFNEKIFAMEFVELMPPTIISADSTKIEEFLKIHEEIVIKPLNGMGGDNIHKISINESESIRKIKDLTENYKTQIIGQKFLSKINEGDFRILIIDGTPFDYCLARIPKDGSFLGNLAKGGKGVAKKITSSQREIGEKVGARLKTENILFAGIDIIDDKLTEINITSPTCAVEIFNQTGENPITKIFDSI
tara:strand:- start:1203 stop:2123 length:921 start_codon:yes stop_codon:yes gene_type:complete